MRVYTLGGRRFWRRLMFLLFLFLLINLALEPLGPLSNSVVHVTAVDKLRPIYSVATKEKKVALTFNACWDPDYTAQILAVLERYGVKATFFLVNIWIKNYPDQARAVAAAGHELGLHSATHPHLSALSPAQIEREIRENQRLVQEVTGASPVFFRAPYGEYNNTVIQVANRLGYETIQWSVDSLDWQGTGAELMCQQIMAKIHPGAIVLFHNNGRYTVEALTLIIEKLQRGGYQMVPLGELLLQGDYYVDPNGIQRSRN